MMAPALVTPAAVPPARVEPPDDRAGQHRPHVAAFGLQRVPGPDQPGDHGLGQALGVAAGAEVAPGRPVLGDPVVDDRGRLVDELAVGATAAAGCPARSPRSRGDASRPVPGRR